MKAVYARERKEITVSYSTFSDFTPLKDHPNSSIDTKMV